MIALLGASIQQLNQSINSLNGSLHEPTVSIPMKDYYVLTEQVKLAKKIKEHNLILLKYIDLIALDGIEVADNFLANLKVRLEKKENQLILKEIT